MVTTPELETPRLLEQLEYQLGLRGIDVFSPTSHTAHLWKRLKESLPEDLEKAKNILAQRDEIIGNAELEAASRISRKAVMRAAQKEAQQVLKRAQNREREAENLETARQRALQVALKDASGIREKAQGLFAELRAREGEVVEFIQCALKLCGLFIAAKPKWQELELNQQALQELLERVSPPAG
jgi:hypothetical protein